MAKLENKILASLIYRPSYYEKVVSFIDPDFLPDASYQIVLSLIKEHYEKYDTSPTVEALLISLGERKISSQSTYDSTYVLIEGLKEPTETEEWLLDTTERFCKDRAIHKALLEGIGVYSGENKKYTRHEIPGILENALNVSFDIKLGHDFVKELDSRHDLYTSVEERLEFDIDLFNIITKGGLKRKSLCIFAAGTGGCKSLTLCHNAASYLMQGKNVLYFTLEMSEESIAERIDANILDMNIHELKYLTKEQYKNKFHDAIRRTSGKLVIKEYPTGQAHANDMKFFINELKGKTGFVPDVIIVDYLTICSSFKCPNSEGYGRNKSVSEELRALAIKCNVPLLTAVQLNRAGAGSNEPDTTDIGESYAIAHTADIMIGIVNNEELEDNEQLLFVQMKNRYNSLSNPKKFRLGVDKSKMRLYNLEDAAVVGQINTTDLSAPEPNFDFDLNTSDNILNTNFNFDND